LILRGFDPGARVGDPPDAAPRRLCLRDDLSQKITTFIKTYNCTAKPFRWTDDAKLLRAA
jgi:hypothetical protein